VPRVCCHSGVRRITPQQADELAAALDLDLDDVGICHACLSFVSFALDAGDEREARSATFRMARDLWWEGLALPTQAALERARKRGVPRAEEALAEIAERGHRTAVVRAIVRRLAAELSRRAREDRERRGFRDADVLEFPPRPQPA
jgi:hypothetical protein